MREPAPLPIGILAGGGRLPLEIARSIERRGRNPVLVLLDGEADADFSAFEVTTVNWGQIGRMIRVFKAAGCREMLFAGRVRRPDLGRIKPDAGFFLALPTVVGLMSAGGDDGVLRGVIGYFEKHGLRVVGPADVAPELVAGAGPLGAVIPSDAAHGDIALGFTVVSALGPFDVGQGVVIANGRVIALEGAEGTDAMLRRVIEARGGRTGLNGVLVKRSKPGQELRVDLPAIGPDTVRSVADAGLEGIAIQAGRTLLIDAPELIRRADDHGVFVLGAADPLRGKGETAGDPAEPIVPIVSVGSGRFTTRLARDAAKGIGVLDALAGWYRSAGVVVIRGHVVAVETGEGIRALLSRGAKLRQWGARRWRRRDGVVVLTHGGDVTTEIIRAVGAADLAGLVVLGKAREAAWLKSLAGAAGMSGFALAIAVGRTAQEADDDR